MNIFKPYYKTASTVLKCYRSTRREIAGADPNEQHPAKLYAKNNISMTREEHARWCRLIDRYLQKYTDDEQRHFLDLLYFRDERLVYVCRECFVEARTAQDWREMHLKNLVALAMQEGLVRVDI